MTTAKKKTMPLVDTAALCKDLAAAAGFIDDRRLRNKIYKAVRQLQLLDKLAKDGLILDEHGKAVVVSSGKIIGRQG